MSSKYYDTSSSVYPDDLHLKNSSQRIGNYFNKFQTPLRNSLSEEASLFDSTGFNDDVYRPYITPPTPFEKSTQNHFESDKNPANPYAQSLWYTFRGNDGNEIEKYNIAATQTHETKPVLVKNNGERMELLPSLMLKTKFQENDIKYKDRVQVQRSSNTQYTRIKSSYAVLSDPTPISENFTNLEQRYSTDDYADLNDMDMLKPLNNPPPYEFITIETALVKKLKLIFALSIKFKSFIEENNILLNSKVTLYLFSNIKTLLLIHFNFLNLILDVGKNKADIEEIIFDHLQRLYHVYPSYLKSTRLRNYFTKLIIQNSKFKTFVIHRNNKILEAYDSQDTKKTDIKLDLYFTNEFEGEEGFYKLITTPVEDFKKILVYLKEYIGRSSPRIDVLIEKFDQHFGEVSLSDNLSFNKDELNTINIGNISEPLYLEIPSTWKNEHKLGWKEIASLNAERQMAYYLRSEMKKEYESFQKVSKLMKNQSDQISKISIYNNYIAKKFIQIDTELPNGGLAGNKYIEHLLDVDEQNKEVYLLVESFIEFLNDESFQTTDQLMKKFCKIAKVIFNNTEIPTSNVVDLIFDINKFRLLFKERLVLLTMKFESFFRKYVEIMGPTNELEVFNTIEILNHYKDRVKQTESNIKNNKGFSEELSRVCAHDRLVRRFFKSSN